MTALANVPPNIDLTLRNLLEQMKEQHETTAGLRGDPMRRGITLGDLVRLGMVEINGNALRSGPGLSQPLTPNSVNPLPVGTAGSVDTTPPPKPAGFTVSAGMTRIVLQWNPPVYDNHGQTEIWRAPANNLSDAVAVGTSDHFMYSDAVEPGETWFYWVRFVSKADVNGPYHATDGVTATSAEDPEALLASLEAALGDADSGVEFTVVSGNFVVVDKEDPTKVVLGTLDGKTIMDGAYMKFASIKAAAIETLTVDQLTGDTAAFVLANIGNATIGSAKLANVIQSTNYGPLSGWAIYKTGQAVFNNIYIRGSAESAGYSASAPGWQLLADGSFTLRGPGGAIIMTTTGVSAGAVSGLGDLATQDSVAAGQVSGLGGLATQDSVAAGNVSGLGGLATRNTVTGVHIENLSVSTLKLADHAVTIPSTAGGAHTATAYINAQGGSVLGVGYMAVTLSHVGGDVEVSGELKVKLQFGAHGSNYASQSYRFDSGGKTLYFTVAGVVAASSGNTPLTVSYENIGQASVSSSVCSVAAVGAKK